VSNQTGLAFATRPLSADFALEELGERLQLVADVPRPTTGKSGSFPPEVGATEACSPGSEPSASSPAREWGPLPATGGPGRPGLFSTGAESAGVGDDSSACSGALTGC
jgi:hypothetical protein